MKRPLFLAVITLMAAATLYFLRSSDSLRPDAPAPKPVTTALPKPLVKFPGANASTPAAETAAETAAEGGAAPRQNFSPDGLLQSEDYLGPDGAVAMRTLYTYDDQQRVKQADRVDSNNQLLVRLVIAYTETGEMTTHAFDAEGKEIVTDKPEASEPAAVTPPLAATAAETPPAAPLVSETQPETPPPAATTETPPAAPQPQ